MMFSAVDIGNTSIKNTIMDGNSIVETLVCDSIPSVLSENRIRGVGATAFCSTRRLSEEENGRVMEEGWWKFDVESNVPLKINYSSLSTLGPDRLASAIGAMTLFGDRNVMIADAGTALTIDLVSAEKEFEGGNISPGLQMRFKALSEFTSRLPRVEWSDGNERFGSDTRSAILCGVKWGMIYEIAGSFRYAKTVYDGLELVITGGDADRLYPLVADTLESETKIRKEPGLIAIGLKTTYDLNHDR